MSRIVYRKCRLPSVKWNQVLSKENPADCASRGLLPAEFINHSLWWSGPAWLRQPSPAWPIHNNLKDQFEFNYEMIDSKLQDSKAHTHVSDISEWELPNKVSTWTKLIRITAFVKRFISGSKYRTSRSEDKSASLSAAELKEASLFWLRYVQQNNFQNEIKALKVNRSVSNSSCLASLSPFLGEDKLIRLGGRIENSPLSFKERHPIILPKHRISDLLITQAHKAALHGGTQLTLRILRQSYWIIAARSSVKSYIHACVTCVRERACTSQQLMGNLPNPRVTPSAPFSHTDVDYWADAHYSDCRPRPKIKKILCNSIRLFRD